MHTRQETDALVWELCNPKCNTAAATMKIVTRLAESSIRDHSESLLNQINHDDPVRQLKASYFLIVQDLIPDVVCRGVEKFQHLLMSESNEIRSLAIELVGSLPQVPIELLAALKIVANGDDQAMRIGAISCLVNAGEFTSRSISELRAAIKTDNSWVVGRAAVSLIRLGIHIWQAIEALLHKVSEPGCVSICIDSLGKCRDKRRARKFLFLLANRPELSEHYSHIVNVLATITPHSKRSLSVILEALDSENVRVFCMVLEGLSKNRDSITTKCVERIVGRLRSPILEIREAAAHLLWEVTSNKICVHVTEIVRALEHERDISVLENLTTLCVRCGSPTFEPLIDLIGRVRGIKQVIVCQLIGAICDDHAVELIKMIAWKEFSPEQAFIMSNFMGLMSRNSKEFCESVQAMLSSNDNELIELALLAIGKGGKESGVFIREVCDLALSDNYRLKEIAIHALKRIGPIAIGLINSLQVEAEREDALADLRRRIEGEVDESQSRRNSFDLSWLGDLDAIEAFTVIGQIFRDHGPISQRKLERLIEEQKEKKSYVSEIPSSPSTVRELIVRLETAASKRNGRKINFLEGETNRPRRLSKDGLAFLTRCESFCRTRGR